MIGRWLSLFVAQTIVRLAGRALLAAGLVAVAVAAAPVTLVAAGAYTAAWLRAMPPGRLLRAAAWCAPMLAVWLGVTLARRPGWVHVAAAPYTAWHSMWQLAAAGSVLAAAAVIAPVAIPLGLVAGALAWAVRIRAMRSGAGGRSPAAAIAFDRRQWLRQVRVARARIAAPGSVPLTTRNDLLSSAR